MKFRDKILALVFFGINIFGLPSPLLYSNFISLVFVKNLLKTKYFIFTCFFVFTLLVYFAIHFYYGVEMTSYLNSLAVYLLVFINVIMAHNYIKYLGDRINLLFDFIVKANFTFFIISVLFLVLDFSKLTWRYYNYTDLSNQGAGIPRFRGFFYEPSYYALMFSPFLLYYFYKFIFIEKSFKTFRNLLFVAIPIVFTWSFGVLLGILLAIVISVIYYSTKYFKINIYFLVAFSLLPIGVLLLLMFNTEIAHRIIMNFKGDDLSTKGRTSNAFEIANHLIHAKSPFFGIGLGQIKVFGQEYIQNYYGYQKWYRVSIPNAFAETLAIFGYTGAFLRLFFQLFLFFYKKCYNNMFSLTLFAFIFIYQFTGSFITSTLEYIIWLMAVMNIFPEFNISNRYAQNYK